MIRIRPARPADIEAVARINVDVWRSTYRGIVPDAFLAGLDHANAVERWERFMQRPESIALVAEVEKEVVGYAMAGRERNGNENYRGEVYGLYVLDEHHGSGIGRKLLGGAARALHEIGIKSMLVWVLDLNPAVGFYRACGGSEVLHKEVEIGGERLQETAFGWERSAEI